MNCGRWKDTGAEYWHCLFAVAPGNQEGFLKLGFKSVSMSRYIKTPVLRRIKCQRSPSKTLGDAGLFLRQGCSYLLNLLKKELKRKRKNFFAPNSEPRTEPIIETKAKLSVRYRPTSICGPSPRSVCENSRIVAGLFLAAAGMQLLGCRK